MGVIEPNRLGLLGGAAKLVPAWALYLEEGPAKWVPLGDSQVVLNGAGVSSAVKGIGRALQRLQQQAADKAANPEPAKTDGADKK